MRTHPHRLFLISCALYGFLFCSTQALAQQSPNDAPEETTELPPKQVPVKPVFHPIQIDDSEDNLVIGHEPAEIDNTPDSEHFATTNDVLNHATESPDTSEHQSSDSLAQQMEAVLNDEENKTGIYSEAAQNEFMDRIEARIGEELPAHEHVDSVSLAIPHAPDIKPHSPEATTPGATTPAIWDTLVNKEALAASYDALSISGTSNLAGLGRSGLRSIKERVLSPYTGRYLLLNPLVADARWHVALEHLREQRCDQAIEVANELLGEQEDAHKFTNADVQYLVGRMHLCAGNRQQAELLLRPLIDHQDFGIAELARKQLGMRSRALDEQITHDTGASLAQKINGARTQAQRGEVEQALTKLRTMRDEVESAWDRYRVRMAEANVLENSGRLDEASEVYLAIYRMTSHWRSSDKIATELEQAQSRMKRQFIPFGDRIDRVRALIGRGRYTHARKVSVENARLRGVSGNELRGWTLFRQAYQSEHERNRARAAQQFEDAEKLIRDPEVRPRLYHGWALALRRLDRDREAIALYERLCDEYPRNVLCDNALYEAGRLYQYLNEHEKAVEKFSLVVGLYPFSEHVPDALWRAALSSYLIGDYAAAIPPLKDIVAYYGEQQDASELTIGLKARYWIGVSYLKKGQVAQAKTWLQSTINHGPLTWYGRLAVGRMEQAGIEPVVRIPQSTLTAHELRNLSSLRVPHNPRLETTAALARLGLWEEALDEVRRQIATHPIPEGAQRLRAALHLINDEPNWAHWIMKSHIDMKGPVHATLRDWGTAFPLDFMELSHHYGNTFGVSPFLVQAIIRQESGFRATVSSPAGAMGLMQVTPGTARYTSQVFFNERPVRRREILNPDTNVRLGTMYIRVHTAHAAEAIPLALAGYNAGPAPLKSWFERYGDRELDAWVESITYRETRGYVRKVMTSFITYAALYGDGNLPAIPLTMPEKLGRWGSVPEDIAAILATDPTS